MSIRRILIATQFRRLTLDTIRSLLPLKDAGLEEFILTYIIPRDEVAFVPFGGYLKDEEERMREEARIRFEDWRDDIVEAGLGVKIFIEVGDPVPEIMKIAETEDVSLIVSGKTKRTMMEKFYVSSHTLDLLRRTTNIPVLVTKACGTDEDCIDRIEEHPFRRPLLATDWSQPSEAALRFLIDLQGAVQKVEVVHVIAIKITRERDISEWKRIEAESRDRLNHYCNLLRNAGIDCETHLAAGHAASEILRLSRELGCSMTVLGTSRKDRLHTFFLGSLSQRTAETSDLPTLLIP